MRRKYGDLFDLFEGDPAMQDFADEMIRVGLVSATTRFMVAEEGPGRLLVVPAPSSSSRCLGQLAGGPGGGQ